MSAPAVSTDLAAFTNGATDSLCDAITNWATAPTTDTESMIQGTACNSYKVSGNNGTVTSVYTFGSAVGLSGKNIYIWMMCTTPAKLATHANGGMRIRVEDASANYGEWYVGGSDTYKGGWICFCVRCDSAYNNKSATAPTLSAITKAGVVFLNHATAGTVSKINCYWDAMRYGTYLRIDTGDSTTPGTFADLYSYDNTNKLGVMTQYLGIYLCQGQIQVGSTAGSTATYFKDTTGSVLAFRKYAPYLAAGAAIFDNQATPVLLSSINEILCQGSSGNTEIYFGDKASGVGYGGPVVLSEQDNWRWKLTASDTNITKFSFAGCNFQDAGITTGQAYNSNKDFTSCTFNRCRTVKAANGIVTKCVFASSPGPALLLTSTTHYATSNTFVGCWAALHLTTTTGTYTITGGSFISNSYDVLNATAGAVTVNFSGCSPAGTTQLTVLTANQKAQSYNNTGAAYVDESTAAYNDTPYDMNLLQAANEASDAYLFGNTASQFTAVGIYIVTPGSGVWTVSTSTGWEYSTGAGTWAALAGVVATSLADFRPTTKGTHMVTFTAPGGGWVTAAYNGITAYWIRAKITAWTSVAYPPKGTEAWLVTTSNTTLASTVTLTVTCKDDSGLAVPLARVRIEKTSDGSLISNGTADANGVYTDATYNYVSDVPVNVISRLKGYTNYKGVSTIGSTGMSIPANMPVDDAVYLP